MFFSVLFCTVRLSIFERFVFASFEPLRFCKKVRFVFPDLDKGLLYSPYEVVFFGTAGRFGPLGGKLDKSSVAQYLYVIRRSVTKRD